MSTINIENFGNNYSNTLVTYVAGNVGQRKEHDFKYLRSGTAVCELSVAVNDEWTDKNTQEEKKITTWVTVTAFGDIAERMNKARTGDFAWVKGTPVVEAWLDKAGQPQSSIKVKAIVFEGESKAGRSGGDTRGSDITDLDTADDAGWEKRANGEDEVLF